MDHPFVVSLHPLVKHKLYLLRQQDGVLGDRDYPSLIRELGLLLSVEASLFLPLTHEPASELYPRERWTVDGQFRPAIVAIVRSGLTMAEGAREIIPTLATGHIGVYNDPVTGELLEFIVTMPPDIADRTVFVIDAFIDSGRTARRAITILDQLGVPPERIRYVCIYVSAAGFENVRRDPLASRALFHCAHVDGLNGAEVMFDDFRDFNERVYRTTRKRSHPAGI